MTALETFCASAVRVQTRRRMVTVAIEGSSLGCGPRWTCSFARVGSKCSRQPWRNSAELEGNMWHLLQTLGK